MGADTDGTVTAYNWTKISGPSAGTITNTASAATSVTGLLAGTYVFSLTVTDNKGATNTDLLSVVVLAGNGTPIANAGPDQTIATSTVNLSGSGTDADGTVTAYNWTKISGPSAGTITNTTSAATSVTGLMAGTHVLSLTVTDNKGATNTDMLSVVVLAGNATPTANAGPDQTITTSTVNLSGSGTDADGTITSYAWKWVSGPNTPTIVSSNSSSTSVTGLQAGTHVLSLTVTDNKGATNTDMLSVVVLNATPTANAGADQSIILPVNITSLAGSGTDQDGTVVNYNWTKLSGPSSYNIVNASSPVTDVSGLVQGVYKFELKVTDNNGAIGLDTVQITVNAAANISPTANAGADQSITLPVNITSLAGSGTDQDGTVVNYTLDKNFRDLHLIMYCECIISCYRCFWLGSGGFAKFQLKVTDNNGAIGLDTVQITVQCCCQHSTNSKRRLGSIKR